MLKGRAARSHRTLQSLHPHPPQGGDLPSPLRNEANGSSSTGGYGLGMSIAQSIVAVHRGKIRADSPAENVLSVLVTLPQ